MKSQDILLLLKLVSLNSYVKSIWQPESEYSYSTQEPLQLVWKDWSPEEEGYDLEQLAEYNLQETHWSQSMYGHNKLDQLVPDYMPSYKEQLLQEQALYSVRALEAATGISKSQISLSLQRCYHNGLAYLDRERGTPRVNTSALAKFIEYGLPYVFPAQRGTVTRGIATAWAAPVLEGRIFSGGELPFIWPDARGNSKGIALEPLYKTVPRAVRQDQMLYALLALVDSMRIGMARERMMATELLIKMLGE